ncbi:hypothetical protein NQ315_006307 [Exocentrus adspersus]|uniref:Zinc finger CCHC domain-containing protein 7 n=1 Tax=Exocentrus adspersus TaxID=1586481 RepID=A0AAV8VZQ3_9CUCU|nr:hypothetical protein NQ315_006307 [Exocentrus adspersus]
MYEVDDELDLEDIECRLYSQVYHVGVENEEADSAAILDLIQSENKVKVHKDRYFKQDIPMEVPKLQDASDNLGFIALAREKDVRSIHSSVSFNTDSTDIVTEGNFNSPIHNNITVNQFTVPLILNSELDVSDQSYDNGRYFVPWYVEHANILDPGCKSYRSKSQRRRYERRMKREKEKQAQKACQGRQKNNHVIFISDESENECVVVNNSHGSSLEEADSGSDDIIYIPPPPVEVINVDVEEELIDVAAPLLLPNETDASPSLAGAAECNDFLDGAGVEKTTDKFNFDLHGADFNNSGDFVRPANPVDYCETESSCSTNDLNREGNCLKTVVFNEVDFPKEDMFSDKNLEGFGSFITPKRNACKNVSKRSDKIETAFTTVESESSGSSSESDYEVSNNPEDVRLPTLSPMHCEKTAPKGAKEKTAREADVGKQATKKDSSQRNQPDGDSSEEESRIVEKLPKKKRRRFCKKNKNIETKRTDVEDISSTKELVGPSDKKKPKNSLLRKGEEEGTNTVEVNATEPPNENQENDVSNKSVKKKKRRSSIHKNNEVDASNSSSTETSTGRTKKKKKRRISIEADTTPADREDNAGNGTKISTDPVLEAVQVQMPDIETVPEHKEEGSQNYVPESDPDLIIVDEVLSNTEAPLEIVLSSDTDDNIGDLEALGQDMELANCSFRNAKNKDGFDYFNIMNKNLCQDYNKFDVEQIQNSQTDDPEAWRVLSTDRLRYLNVDAKRGPRCNRCRRFGHIAVRCPEKPFAPSCTLCGFPGHQEPRCPNKRCNQCGNEGDYSTTYCWRCFKFRHDVCRLCHMKGHIADNCPDLWRRYHITIREGPLMVPEQAEITLLSQLWCSGCAGQGHLEHECNYYNRAYPPTTPYIMSYEDVYPVPTFEPLVWDQQEQHSALEVIPPAPTISDLYTAPCSSIPPLVPELMGPDCLLQEEINVNPASTKVLNPFSALVRTHQNALSSNDLEQMMREYLMHVNNAHYMTSTLIPPHLLNQSMNNFLKKDQRRIRGIIMSMPCHVVKRFLNKELADLENIVSQSDPKFLRGILFKYDNLSKSKRNLNYEVVLKKCFWYRVLNMFIFGVHHLKEGRVNIDYIRRYISESKQNKLDSSKRKSLLNAYNYVFEGGRHENVNYYKVIENLIKQEGYVHSNVNNALIRW